ncbi:MAG TPA: ATP-binding protein [Methylomirabilota bacterium]|nr:ATP-binding protein [Methylomirabilota bacterium]
MISVALAWALTLAVPALGRVPTAAFFAAVTLTTFYGHLGPGLLATALSAAVLDYSFLPPIRDFAGGLSETVRVATFALAATLMNSLHERRRLAEAQRRESEARERRSLEAAAQELRLAHEEVARALADRENIMESVADILYTLDGSGTLTGWNRRLELVTSFQPEELKGRPVFEMFEEEDRAAVAAAIRAAVRGGHGEREARLVCKDGTPIPYQFSCVPLRNPHGEVIGLTGVGTDISERKRLEEQLWQSQKMEAVGRLAGGVAHDFGNLLTVVHARAQLALQRLGPASPARPDVELIDAAAARAGTLVRQLLAFSRKQVLQPKVLDVNAVVEAVEHLLQPLIGVDISFRTTLAPALGRVKADPIQLEQVLINLVVNARDAMPQGGALTVETADVDLDEPFVREHAGATSGAHVVLRVRDTGTGMDAATRARIFEPFFTTKQLGKGTGLGLATVYGIVKQHGGFVAVDTEPGRGSTFAVYLPRVDAELDAVAPARPASTSGGETVLVVDDDQEVRALACEVLRRHRYVVLEAPTPAEALAIAGQHKEAIDLLITDVVMPGMSGRQLAEQIAPIRPDTRIMYMSGYTDDVIGKHGVLAAGAFIQKPFTPSRLVDKVREVLGTPAARERGDESRVGS